MAFNGSEGGTITLAAGAALTAAFRANFPTQIKGRFFGKDKLNQILNQTGCKGIRMYFGQDASGNLELVLCGADASENDMLTKIMDLSIPCPTSCGDANELNR